MNSCCLLQCAFFEYLDYKIVFRRYAALFFIVGVDNDEVSVHSTPHFLLLHYQNELSVLEFIHAYVETLDRYFENVVSHSCHSDIIT